MNFKFLKKIKNFINPFSSKKDETPKESIEGVFDEWVKKSKDQPTKTFLGVFYTKIDNSRQPLCCEYKKGNIEIGKILFAIDSKALFFMEHKIRNKDNGKIEKYRVPVVDCFEGETFAKSPRLEYNQTFSENTQIMLFNGLKNKIMDVKMQTTQDIKDFLKDWGIFIAGGIFVVILIKNYFAA